MANSIIRLLLIAVVIITTQRLSAQDYSTHYYMCLQGEYVGSPVFLEMMKTYAWKPVMYNFIEGTAYVNDDILIKHGKVDQIRLTSDSKKWSPKDFPKAWNIKIPYNAMYATNKEEYPKPPDYKYERIIIIKKIDSLRLELVYSMETTGRSGIIALKDIYFSGKAAWCEGCSSYNPPAPVWNTFLGNEGGELPEWLVEHMGKPLSNEFMENNFIEVEVKKDLKYCPADETHSGYYDYYDFHAMPASKYYMSMDGTTIIGTNYDGAIREIVFYPDLIPVEVLPAIERDYSEKELESSYPQIKHARVMQRYSTLKTDNFEIEYSYTSSGKLGYINIYLKNDKVSGGSIEQFAFYQSDTLSERPYSPNKIIKPSDYDYKGNDKKFDEAVASAFKEKFNYLGCYNFELTEGEQVTIDGKSSNPLYNYLIIVEPEEGVSDVEFLIYDPVNMDTLAMDTAAVEYQFKMLQFSGVHHQQLSQFDIIVKNRTSEYRSRSYAFKVHIYYYDYHNMIELPEQHTQHLHNQGFTYYKTIKVDVVRGEKIKVDFDIEPYTSYAVDVFGTTAVSDIEIVIWLSAPIKLIGMSKSQPDDYDNIAYSNLFMYSPAKGEIEVIVKKAKSGTIIYPLKIFLFKKDVPK